MENYKIYAFSRDGENEVYETFVDKGFLGQIEKYLNLKSSLGESLTDADLVYKTVFFDGYNVVKSQNFKKVMQSLRHHDEIGLSNDIYSILEEISDDGSYIAVGFGNDLDGKCICDLDDKMADLSKYSI